MKALKLIFSIPTIVIAVALGILFYVTMVINKLCGMLFFGWLQLTADSHEVEELNAEQNGSK